MLSRQFRRLVGVFALPLAFLLLLLVAQLVVVLVLAQQVRCEQLILTLRLLVVLFNGLKA